MSVLTDSPAWQAVATHHASTANVTLQELFAADPQRVSRFSDEIAGITVDAAKTHLTPSVLDDLLALADQQQVLPWRDRMFAGERVNHTENRPALHAALRTPELADVEVDGMRVGDAVADVHRRMRAWVDGVDSGDIRAADGGPHATEEDGAGGEEQGEGGSEDEVGTLEVAGQQQAELFRHRLQQSVVVGAPPEVQPGGAHLENEGRLELDPGTQPEITGCSRCFRQLGSSRRDGQHHGRDPDDQARHVTRYSIEARARRTMNPITGRCA